MIHSARNGHRAGTEGFAEVSDGVTHGLLSLERSLCFLRLWSTGRFDSLLLEKAEKPQAEFDSSSRNQSTQFRSA